MSLKDETLTVEEALNALDEEWKMVVQHKFRQRGITREPTAQERIVAWVASRRNKRDYHQLALFE